MLEAVAPKADQDSHITNDTATAIEAANYSRAIVCHHACDLTRQFAWRKLKQMTQLQ